MNLAIRGTEAYFGPEHEDTFRRDLHPGLRADYGLAFHHELVTAKTRVDARTFQAMEGN